MDYIEITEDKKRKRAYAKLIVACMFIYGMSMATKTAFVAEIAEIVEIFGISRATASMANTLYYITYAVFQIILSFTISKLKIKRFLGISTIISAILIIAITFAQGIYFIWIMFALNGIFTAGIYAGIMILLTKYLPKNKLPLVNKFISMLSLGSNFLSNGVAVFCVAYLNWKITFTILGVIYLFSGILFILFATSSIKFFKAHKTVELDVEEVKTVETKSGFIKLNGKKDVVIITVLNCTLVFFISTLYYSINNWFSKIIYDVYNVPITYSMLITLGVPLLMSISPIIMINICKKKKNLYLNGLICLGIPVLLPLFLCFFFDFSLVGFIILILVYLFFVSAGRVVLSSMFAFEMKEELSVGYYSAISNAFSSASAGISPTIVGLIADLGGYSASFLSIFISNVIILVLLLTALIIFRKKINIKPKIALN